VTRSSCVPVRNAPYLSFASSLTRIS
jgi:hypothetical protein